MFDKRFVPGHVQPNSNQPTLDNNTTNGKQYSQTLKLHSRVVRGCVNCFSNQVSGHHNTMTCSTRSTGLTGIVIRTKQSPYAGEAGNKLYTNHTRIIKINAVFTPTVQRKKGSFPSLFGRTATHQARALTIGVFNNYGMIPSKLSLVSSPQSKLAQKYYKRQTPQRLENKAVKSLPAHSCFFVFFRQYGVFHYIQYIPHVGTVGHWRWREVW